MFCAGIPRPTESAPWGSRSMSSTRRPYSVSAAPRLMVDVVLPTPPFWLHSATTRAGPCDFSGCGSGTIRGFRWFAGLVALASGPPGRGAHVVDSEEGGVLPVAHCRHAHQSVGLSNVEP